MGLANIKGDQIMWPVIFAGGLPKRIPGPTLSTRLQQHRIPWKESPYVIRQQVTPPCQRLWRYRVSTWTHCFIIWLYRLLLQVKSAVFYPKEIIQRNLVGFLYLRGWAEIWIGTASGFTSFFKSPSWFKISNGILVQLRIKYFKKL